MEFNEELGGYVHEADGVICMWDETPEYDYKTEAKTIADSYKNQLSHIVDFMLPDLQECFGDVSADEVKEKLGRPIIEPARGTVTYCEQTFDSVHIFMFEYCGELEDLESFSIDG